MAESINPKIKALLKVMHGTIRTEDVRQLGFSKQLISEYCRDGLLVNVHRGVYMLPSNQSVDDQYLLLSWHSQHIIFSHASAQFLLGLRTEPYRFFITLPSNKMKPESIKEDCDAFYIKPELYELGLLTVKTRYRNTVKCYDNERTLCDFIRSRRRFSERELYEGIRYYLTSNKIDAQKLNDYAEKLNVNKNLKQYLLAASQNAAEIFLSPVPRLKAFELFNKNLTNLLCSL